MAISACVALIRLAVERRIAFVGLHPFRVMLAAVVEGILREALHGFGGGPAERGDGGMVEINEPLSDRKLVPVLLPQTPFSSRRP